MPVVAGVLVCGTVVSAPAGAAPAGRTIGPSVPHASGALSTLVFRVLHGGYSTAGAGMRDIGRGTLTISGDPAGAHVVSAILMWDFIAHTTPPLHLPVNFAVSGMSHSLLGNQWASGGSPCWPASFRAWKNWSYEANVTSFVTTDGNGAYTVRLRSGLANHANPWTTPNAPQPLLEGASLIVIYRLKSMPQTVIQVAEGASEATGPATLTATLNGFNATGGAGTATTTFIVADAQKPFSDLGYFSTAQVATFSGTAPQVLPDYSRGNLWDDTSANVGSLVAPASTSANISVMAATAPHAGRDCIVWVGQVLSVNGP